MTTTLEEQAVEVKEITYNKDCLNLINSLSNISEKVLVEKTEEGQFIKIDGKNKDTTVAYKFNAPVVDFNFDGDTIGFYDFPEFFTLVSEFDEPVITQVNDDKVQISKGKAKLSYHLADEEAIKKPFQKIKFEDPDAVFTLTEANFAKISSMIGKLKAENVSIIIEDNEVRLRLFTGGRDNEFEETFEISDSSGEEFEITLTNEIFTLAPKGDYTISVKEEGIVQFNYENEDGFDLKLFTAEIEE